MKTNNLIAALWMTLVIFSFSACKNTNSDKATSDENNTEKVESGEEGDSVSSQPLLSVAELMDIYDHYDDTKYFESKFSDKGMTLLLANDYKNEDGVPDGEWYSELWGFKMKYDSSKEQYEEALTSEGDEALALLVNHTDDPDACIYFFNPAYKDIYLKQIEEQGYKHLVGEDEFGSPYDLYAKEGYKPGHDIDKVFNLTQEHGIYVLSYAFL